MQGIVSDKDATIQVHKDAMKYIHAASEAQDVLDGNIYKLLLKNISRNDPLTREEAQELKAFRDSLTMEQWNGWLQFARNEKSLLKKMIGKQKSPSKSSAVLKQQSPNELLQALMKKDPTWHSSAVTETETETAQRTDDGPEVMFHKSAHSVVPERVALANAASVSWDSTAVASNSADEQNVAHLHTASLDATSSVESTEIPVEVVNDSGNAGHTQQQHRPLPQGMTKETAPSARRHVSIEVPVRPTITAHSIEAPAVEARAAVHAVHTSAPAPVLSRGLDVDLGLDVGVSLDRGILHGRGRGGKHRPASAPRERPQARSVDTIDSHHAHIGPNMGSNAGTSPFPNPAPSASFRGHSSDDQGAYARAHQQPPFLTHSPRQRPAQDGMFNGHSHTRNTTFTSAQERPRSSHSFSASCFHGTEQHNHALAPEDRRRHGQRERTALDLAEAAEIARSTAFRLDSAYSAAQCLLGSFAADNNLSAQFHTGTSMATATHAVEPSDSQKMQATLSILTEMMSSMEKSREALEQLSSLHITGSAPIHLLRRSPEHGNSAASAYNKRRGRSNRHTYGAVSTNGTNSSTDRKRDSSISPEGPFSTSAEIDQGVSPLDGVRFRGFDEHPRSAGDSSEVLSFEDLSNTNRVFSPVHLSKPSSNAEPDLTPFGSLRSRSDLAWYPNNSLSSGGAKLNAAHMQERTHDDFSEWNRQLSTSANLQADQGTPFDAKASLQSQLFDAADSARRTNVYNFTLALTPQGGKSQQFQYSSSGYIWEGVRYARAQGPVVRLCCVSGPLLKDEYPVRVDAERRTADVVWREVKLGAGGNVSADGSQTATRGMVLRRERFAFDDVFVGQSAEGRLSFFARQRARKALECGHNLAFLSLACGDANAHDQSRVEPPVSLLMGSGGGTGLISSAIDEIFRFVKPLTMSMQDSHHLYPGGLPTSSPSAFIASKVAFEQVKSRVTMSAVILSEGGAVYDLLSTSAGPAAVGGTAHLKRRKSDGRVTLCDVSRLQLQATADFDRVMGLLLGKRTALQSVLQTFQLQHAQQQRLGVHQQNDPMQSVLSSIDPWASFSSKGRKAGDTPQNETGVCASSMLISVSVSGGAVSSTQTSVDFHFVSPCGKDWSCPGSDINILAELVSGLPNQPPTSLLRASPLGMLLMDPRNGKTDFVNVVTVHREKESSNNSAASASVVHGALHSLRIIAQITQ